MITATNNNKPINAIILGSISYKSKIMELYLPWLGKQYDSCVLDLGPTCDETINFFLPQVGKFFIHDIFQLLSKQISLKEINKQLDYEPCQFDGIHLWDLLFHADAKDIPLIISKCLTLLKPGGALIITGYDEFMGTVAVNSFAISDNNEVTLRPKINISLPYFHKQNRDLNILLSRFYLYKSYVYRCGIREFYFRKH